MTSTGAGGWLSAYVYFGGDLYGSAGDRVVLDAVAPFLDRANQQGWIDQHFFVRYNERGPHIRVRMHGSTTVLDTTVRAALVAHTRALWPEVVVGDGLPASGDSAARPAHAVRWVPYAPETERYGGREAVPVAEALFAASSRAALALLRKMDPDDRPSRLGKALLAALVLVHVFTANRARAAAFAQTYGSSNLHTFARQEGQEVRWLQSFDAGYSRQAETLSAFVSDAWARLDEGEELVGELDCYLDELAAARENLSRVRSAGRLRHCGKLLQTEDDEVRHIVPSHMHMMNNRLGVTIQEEAYLAYLIRRALETPLSHAERVSP